MANRRARSEFTTEAEWGRAVRDWLGVACAVCRSTYLTQADHIIPRAQGGLNDLHNGWMICGPYDCAAHALITANLLKIDPNLLRAEHLLYLADHNYVIFDPTTGEPFGRGMRRFERLRSSPLS